MFQWCRRWLAAAGLLFAVFGLLLAVFNQTPIFNLFVNSLVDPVFCGSTAPSPDYLLFQKWVYGVLGATCAGWGITIALIAWYGFPLRQSWVWYTLLIGISLWFVPDTLISLASGVYFNVVINIALLLAVVIPLALVREEFGGRA